MIKIYTDGSCLNNPGNGGWAAIINLNNEVKKISGSVKDTTNNKMELMAPIKALQTIEEKQPIEIYTDSQYVRLGITDWVHKWIKNNWLTSKDLVNSYSSIHKSLFLTGSFFEVCQLFIIHLFIQSVIPNLTYCESV